MKLLASLIAAAALILCANGFSINDASVVGDGADSQNPANEGDSFGVRCAISGNEEWVLCSWVHEIDGYLDENNLDLRVVCAATPGDSGKTCTNVGGSHELDQYAQRIQIEATDSYCGLRITRADPMDTGPWACNVFGGVSMTPQFAQVEAFVSNQSRILITKPDLEDDPKATIEYDMSASRPEIEATCTAYGGFPDPTFHWYVGDDRNEISDRDYSASIVRSSDQKGEFVAETITYSPSVDELCQFDELDQYCYDAEFNFNLQCRVDQGDYYQRENEQQVREVLVNVRSGGVRSTISVAAVILLVASLKSFF